MVAFGRFMGSARVFHVRELVFGLLINIVEFKGRVTCRKLAKTHQVRDYTQ